MKTKQGMRIILLFLMLCTCLASEAQKLTVEQFYLRKEDTRARTNPRDDAKGNKCAIIRVAVVGVDDLVFPDAVGEVEYKLNEYVVYVAAGLKKFRYKNKAGNIDAYIDFAEWELDEAASQATYSLVFDAENHLRSAIFTNLPPKASLRFDGQWVAVEKDGTAMVNKPVGEYHYLVRAKGYKELSGKIILKEDEISTPIVVAMEQIKHKVTINVSPSDASLFVDNIPYNKTELELTEGKHTIRATAPYYDEERRTITVNRERIEKIELKKAELEIVEHKEEASHTSINVRNALYHNLGVAMMGVDKIDKTFDKENALDVNFEISWVGHFAGFMGIRVGAGIGLIVSNENEKYLGLAYNSESDSLECLMHVDVPLQIGFSLPFGKYNQHMFNVFGGGYGSYIWQSGLEEKEVEPGSDLENRIVAHEEKDKDSKVDYGIRLSLKLDLSHFVIGADLSQSLNGMGFSVGANIGWKLFKKKED